MMKFLFVPVMLLYMMAMSLFSIAQTKGRQGDTGAHSKTTSGTDKRISAKGATISEAEVFIAMHPVDSNKLVLSYLEADNSTQVNGTFPVYYSGDGGKTWDRSLLNTDQIFLNETWFGATNYESGNPSFAWDKNGRIYMSFILSGAAFMQGPMVIYLLSWLYSDDDGKTWVQVQGLQKAYMLCKGTKHAIDGTTSTGWNGGVPDWSCLAIDNSNGPRGGDLYAGFNFETTVPAKAYLEGEVIRVKKSGTNNFDTLVPAVQGNIFGGNLNVDSKGTLHFTYTDLASDLIRHCYSTDGGLTFSSAVDISSVINPEGTGNAIHNQANVAVNSVFDGKENLHVVWSEYPPGRARAFYSRSANGGVTWTNPVNIGDTWFSPSDDAFMPTVAARGDNIAISLYVREAATGHINYFGMNSRDNGASFKQVQRLSSETTDSFSRHMYFGDYNTTVRSNCKVYSAWADGRSVKGVPKIYVAATDYCMLGVSEVTLVNAGVQVTDIYPNPARDYVMVDVSSEAAGEVTCSITDLTGKAVYSSGATLERGNQSLKLHYGNLATGMYMLSVHENATLVSTHRVYVRR